MSMSEYYLFPLVDADAQGSNIVIYYYVGGGVALAVLGLCLILTFIVIVVVVCVRRRKRESKSLIRERMLFIVNWALIILLYFTTAYDTYTNLNPVYSSVNTNESTAYTVSPHIDNFGE